MADTRRRTAADARRMTDRASQGKATTDEVRALLRRTHDRGVEEGREQMRNELDGLDVRRATLDLGAEIMDLFAARVSGIPNSHRTFQAFTEAGALLTDARREGEPPEPEDAEATVKAAHAAEKKKAAKKPAAKRG